jgi:hypothetical protein|tara:strand:- start:55 stop:381 length:327 start_codon:yes stop_codon:yes gene_type:complete
MMSLFKIKGKYTGKEYDLGDFYRVVEKLDFIEYSLKNMLESAEGQGHHYYDSPASSTENLAEKFLKFDEEYKKDELVGEGYDLLVRECFNCGEFVVGLTQCACKGEIK